LLCLIEADRYIGYFFIRSSINGHDIGDISITHIEVSKGLFRVFIETGQFINPSEIDHLSSKIIIGLFFSLLSFVSYVCLVANKLLSLTGLNVRRCTGFLLIYFAPLKQKGDFKCYGICV